MSWGVSIPNVTYILGVSSSINTERDRRQTVVDEAAAAKGLSQERPEREVGRECPTHDDPPLARNQGDAG